MIRIKKIVARQRRYNDLYCRNFLYDKKGMVLEMPIIMRLDRVMADRKMSLKELSEKVGVANVNLSKIKTGKISAIRFSTLEAICDILDCQPGDILEYQREEKQTE